MILYTTNCPKCRVLEQQLSFTNLKFEKETDVKTMIDLGFVEAPMLEIKKGLFLTFREAINYIKEIKVCQN